MGGVPFRALGTAKLVSCLLYCLRVCLQFPETVLNVAQLFNRSVHVGYNTIDFAQGTTSILLWVEYIPFPVGGETQNKLRLNY